MFDPSIKTKRPSSLKAFVLLVGDTGIEPVTPCL